MIGFPAHLWLATVLLLWPVHAFADGQREDTNRPDPQTGWFDAGSVGLEFAGGPFVEAWNLNEGREWLLAGTAGVWWAVTDRALLLTEFHVARVFQDPSRPAFINGFAPLVRWRLRRGPPWTLFADVGPGISWSDTAVPPRGTRFNFLLLGGGGAAWPIGRQVEALVGVRWIHLSNNGREGRRRNPDIEALGAYVGLSLALSR